MPTLTVAFATTWWMLKLLQVLLAPAVFPQTLVQHALVAGIFFAALFVATRIFLDHQRFWSWRAGVLAAAIVSLVVALLM